MKKENQERPRFRIYVNTSNAEIIKYYVPRDKQEEELLKRFETLYNSRGGN